MYRTGYRKFSLKVRGVEEPEPSLLAPLPTKMSFWKDFLVHPVSEFNLANGFSWRSTENGHDFWGGQRDRLLGGLNYTDEAWEIIQSWRRQEGYV